MQITWYLVLSKMADVSQVGAEATSISSNESEVVELLSLEKAKSGVCRFEAKNGEFVVKDKWKRSDFFFL